MTHALAHPVSPSTPAATAGQPLFAHQQLHPRLARRELITSGGSKAWITPGFGASTAFISLSPGLVCVFDAAAGPGDGEALTHQEIGSLGLTAHQAWNAAADTLRATAVTEGGVEFWSRPAAVALGDRAPHGVEVRGGAHTAAAWLAHPRTFEVIHTHFTTVLAPSVELTYFSRDQRELFIFDAHRDDIMRALGPAALMRYSLGFPLLLR